MDVSHILLLVQDLFTKLASEETINLVKTGPTYFQILPEATCISYSDHTRLSVPPIHDASIAFKIFACLFPWPRTCFYQCSVWLPCIHYSGDGSPQVRGSSPWLPQTSSVAPIISSENHLHIFQSSYHIFN